jgi:hypothetical protein
MTLEDGLQVLQLLLLDLVHHGQLIVNFWYGIEVRVSFLYKLNELDNVGLDMVALGQRGKGLYVPHQVWEESLLILWVVIVIEWDGHYADERVLLRIRALILFSLDLKVF